MAKISFDSVPSVGESSNTNSVGFFTLKNDGDEAIVRIMHDTVEDFDILTTHPISLGGKFRTVNCLRDPRDPMEQCPLCKNGTKVQSRIFIHMIQYVKNNQGQVVATPVVWERGANEYGTKLKTLMSEYGPLSNNVFKIRRNGKTGDTNTTYEILYGSPNMYSEQVYPKVPGAFDNFSACGVVVLDKSYDEIMYFISTGNFPEKAKSSNSAPAGSNTASAPTTAPSDASRMPWESPAPVGEPATAPTGRPTRYY